MSYRAVFLDRDGTLNEDPGYIKDPDQLKLFPETGNALRLLKQNNFKLIVVSNQSGVARGLMTTGDVDSVNLKLNELLKEFDVQIDAFYYCPFHPDYNSEEEARCRKPSPKLVFLAANENEISLRQSYFIGDSEADIECGMNAGLKTVLVKTGRGSESISILQKQNKFPSFIAENILDAAKLIIDDFNGANS
jgi:D,D-heptose 1,7-bisphosphate phosphatase